MLSRTRVAALMPAMLLLILICTDASAQVTGGVYGPVVTPDHQSLEYRIGFDPDTDAVAQRIHYQRSLNGSFRWRVLALALKTEQSNLDFDHVEGELTWDVTDADRDWRTGFRFDLRVRDRGRPVRGAVSWINEFRLTSAWGARVVGVTSFEVGSGARDGLGLQTRASLYRTKHNGPPFGLDLQSVYGTTEKILDPDDQFHQLGPFARIPLKDGWSIFGTALFGLTDATPDTNLGLWVGRSF